MMVSWITPSIFQNLDGSVVDEWTLCEKVPNASDILRKHWDSWVSLQDFQKIKEAGFNTVRIPIGCMVVCSRFGKLSAHRASRLGLPKIHQ